MNTVLIIEDSAIISEPIAAVLKRSGYDAMVASNGVEALKQIRAKRVPDLILLDIEMPVMDGLTLLDTLRANDKTRDVPVIVLTGIADKQRVTRAVQLGIKAYLLKSRFSLDDLLAQIAKAIGQPPQQAPPAFGDSTVIVEESEAGGTESAPGPFADGKSTVQSSAASKAHSPPFSPLSSLPQEPKSDEGDLRLLRPILSRTKLMEKIESCGEIKGLSPAVAQVLKLTGSSRCSIEQVARAISQDHGMALKVLKLANSAVYTRGEPVDSVQTAVMRIGLGQIRQTVLNISVIEHFSRRNGGSDGPHLDMAQFWEHAIATGLIAAGITRCRDHPKEADTAFTLGLLHDVGRLYLAEQFGEAYPRVLEVASRLHVPVEQVEARMLLYNHADLMDRLLHGWKFPKQLINPIVFHHLSAGNIRRSAPRQIEEVATLGLANRLAHAMMLGSSGNETIYPTEELCQLLKLKANVLDSIAGYASDASDGEWPTLGIRAECDKMKFALLVGSGGDAANWPQLRQVHRDQLTKPLRPIFVSATPHFDGCRVFCQELSEPLPERNEASLPNLGVIHLAQARERVSLTSEFKAAEQAAGASNLPLLILSPAGKILPETALLAGRQHEALAAPFTVPSFIEAANRLLAGAQSSGTRAKAA